MTKHSVPTQADRAFVVGLLLETPFGPAWRAAQDLALDVFESTRFEGEATCTKCQGTGRFVAIGADPLDPNVCYHCAGKGWITKSDKARNKAYAKFQAARRQQTLGL